MTDLVNGQIPDCRGWSEAAEDIPGNDKAMYTQKSMANQLARPIQFLLPSMVLGTEARANAEQRYRYGLEELGEAQAILP